MVDLRAVDASVATLSFISVLSAAVIWVRLTNGGRSALTRLLTSVPVVMVAGVAAVVVVRPVTALGADPTRDRPGSELVCSDSVCLWPEDEGVRGINEASYRAIKAAWRQLGLVAPDVNAGPIRTARTIGLTSRSSLPGDALVSMAAQYPRAVKGCEQSYDNAAKSGQFDGIAYRLYILAGGTSVDAQSQILVPGEPVLSATQAREAWRKIGHC